MPCGECHSAWAEGKVGGRGASPDDGTMEGNVTLPMARLAPVVRVTLRWRPRGECHSAVAACPGPLEPRRP
jgi:hypothetical protein